MKKSCESVAKTLKDCDDEWAKKSSKVQNKRNIYDNESRGDIAR